VILDKGICTIFRRANAAEPGRKPTYTYTVLSKSWYGELDYETSPARPTEGREENLTDARIRILQNRAIRQGDCAVLHDASQMEAADTVFRITRAYHGTDDESTEPITDLTLEVFTP
jgi:hypothetical protein